MLHVTLYLTNVDQEKSKEIMSTKKYDKNVKSYYSLY